MRFVLNSPAKWFNSFLRRNVLECFKSESYSKVVTLLSGRLMGAI
jgi:hypothetical protein